MKKPDDLRIETVAAQAGGFLDASTGGVVPPIQPSTTFARDRDYQLTSPDHMYVRYDNDAVRLAESILAAMEGADEALVFPSGMAAIAAVVRTVPTGGRLVLQSGIYWGTTKWIREYCERHAIDLVECDASDTETLAAAIAEHRPDLVFVETPSNPWLLTVDIEAAADACRTCQANATLVVDSTAATPVLSRPLELGADIVMHAATKAINGHSDVLAGSLATANPESERWQAIRTDRHDAGAVLGTFEAWLLIRGMRTLPLRMERMSENALALARHLSAHPAVEAVYYPGLETHAGHALAVKQMHGGFGSLLSFLVRGNEAETLAVCGRLDLFHRATSLGGVESLVEHRFTVEGPDTGIPPNLIRLSVGIEHRDDLITDMDRALEGMAT